MSVMIRRVDYTGGRGILAVAAAVLVCVIGVFNLVNLATGVREGGLLVALAIAQAVGGLAIAIYILVIRRRQRLDRR